jgi:TP901 family phage tail tape measure protein
LADKDLSISIGVDLDIDEKAAAKKLDDVARRLGTTGEKMLKDLNIEINVTNIDKVQAKLQRLVGSVSTAQEELSKFNEDFSMLGALSTPGPAANAFYARLRDGLGLTEKTNDALTRQLNLRQRIAKEIFDDPNQDFSVGRFVRPDNLKIKSYAKGQNNQVEKELKDFNSALEDALSDGLVSERELDDLRESGDLLSASIMEINDAVEEFAFGSGEISDSIKKINNALADAVQVAVVEIKDEFELLPNTVMDKLDSSGKVSEDLQQGAVDLAVILNKINDGLVLTETELEKVKNIKFADVLNEDNVKTGIKPIIDAATFLSAYNKVLAENPLPTVGIGNIKREDRLKASKYEAKQFPKGIEQASDKVIDSFVEKLEKVIDEPGGEDRARRRFEEIQTSFFDDVLQRALTRANSASAERFNTFEEDPVYGYAPNAIQPGKVDDANIGRRYVDEDVAKFIYQEMLKAGLHPSTFAALAPNTFSKKFGENIGVSEGGPAGYNVQDVLRAARSASFPTGLGRQDIQISPSAAGDLSVPAATFSIVNQVLSNPAILKKLTSITPPTLESRKGQAFNELTATNNGYPWKGIMKEATDLAYAIRFVERIKEEKLDKPSPNDLARQRAIEEARAAANAPAKPNIDIQRSVAIARRRQEEEAAGDKGPRTLQEKAADKAYGQAQARLIAQRRDRIRKDAEAFDKAWDEAHAEEARRNSGAPAVVESKPEIKASVQKRVAKKVEAIEGQIEEAAVAETKGNTSTTAPSASTAAALKQTNWLDDAKTKLLAAQEESARQGKPFSVALDTEFNRNTKQSVNELSAVFRNAAGDFEEIFSFIHIPSDYKQMGKRFGGETDESYRSRAKSAEDLAARAKVLGLDPSKLGDIEDPELNFQMLRKKTASLVGLLELLQNLNIPITGSNVASAEGSNIGELIKFVNEMSAARGLSQFKTPTNLKQGVWDSTQQFKKAKDNPEIASILGPTGKGFGLQKLITGIAESTNLKHQEWLSKYSNVFRMDPTKGSQVKLPGTGELPAHYAAADAAMSLIVQDFFDTFAETLLRMEQITIPASGLPGKPLASGGGSGKPPSQPPVTSGAADEDPMANRAVANAQRAFHARSEYNRMLAGLTRDEYKIATDRLRLLQSDAQQVEIATQLIARESAIKDKRTELAKLRLSAPDSAEYKAVRDEVSKLDDEIIKLTNAGRKNEAAVVERTLSEGRYKQMQEQVRLNTRKQIDTDFERSQAGKRFSAQIKANLKAELEASKAVQKANREQVNQWVTARYALYDVGNFYQNLSQQLFGLTRQILGTTGAYKKFETSFTSVERAMQLAEDASVDMRNQFIGLSEVLPITFEDLSKIATLGAQMGISAGGIKQFTQTVAEFSAITSISADTVAQKFGRIAELANIDSSQFANLGSAVAYAGINAVATESEILTLAESIAAASEQSGFMPEEIIGMSTALASVGIQAEQARGVFTRVFADIDRAVSRGGSELDNFAKASGMSAKDFAKQWGTEGETYNVFRRLLGGLGGSGDLTKTFDSLNIVETREINTLTRLANNLNVVDRAVSDANASYAEGIFLSQSFAKTSDNLDSQLIIFRNNLDSFSASFSKVFGESLKNTVKVGSEFLNFLKGASESPWAQGLLPAAAAITAIGAAATLATAGFSKLIAQIYAFRVAQINGMNASGTDITSLSGRIKQLTGAYSDLVEVRGGLRGVGTVEDKGVVTPVTYNAGAQFKAQKDALADLAKNRDIASARNIISLAKEQDLLKSSNILLVTAASTKKADIQVARAQADSIQRAIENQKMQNAALVERFKIDELGQAKLANKSFFVEIIDNEAVAITRGTVAQIDNEIASARAAGTKNIEAEARRRNIKEMNQETVAATSAATTFGSKVMNGVSKALGVVAIAATVVSAVAMIVAAIEDANKIKLLESGGGVQSLREAIAQDTEIWKKTGEAVSKVEVQYADFTAETYLAHDAIVEVTGANKNLKSATGDVTESIKTQTLAIGQNTKEWMLNAIIGNEKVNGWLEENPGLFSQAEAALRDYGSSFSQVINEIVRDPKGGGEVAALSKIDGAIEKVRKKAAAYFREWSLNNPDAKRGSNPGKVYVDMLNQQKALERVKQIVREIALAMSQGLDTSALRASLSSALGVVDELDGGVKELTGSVKTLTQWAGEVGQVMQAAFDIRYGKITALDNIRKAWSDLRKKADDARKAVKKAQDQLNALKANRTVLEYQFSIAIKYGDSKRAAEIQAKLEENTNSTTEATDQLKEAQDNLSTDLRSGSDAAIQNRSALSGLVQTYIPYLQALLNSGKSQKDVAIEADKLKAEFKKQAMEIGFAESDLKGYVGTFDSYKKVITEMPKTVTVSIKGLDEAARAMKEFAAAVNGMKKDPIIDPATVAALAKAAERTEAIAKYKNLAVESSLLEKRIGAGAMSPRAIDQLSINLSGIKAEMAKLDKKYSLINPYSKSGQMNTFATGGYVSGPGTGTSDSIPARLSNGEFVMSAKTVATYGVDFMNSLNQSRVMYAPAQSSTAQVGGGSSVVYLSPDDRALLRAAIDRPVNLYANGTRLAQSVNDGNKVLAQRGSV